MNTQLSFIDFFSGIGGFRHGFELAGFRCVGNCEKDKFAVKAYRAMFNTEGEWFSDDITRLRPDDIPYADVWTFGFPCQDISVAGHLRGLGGARSGLYFKIIGLVKGKAESDKPRWLVAENVRNLLSVGRGWDFLSVVCEMAEAGYDVEWQVLNSRDFGVPHNRERVFIVGHLREHGSRKILPVEGPDHDASEPVGIDINTQRAFIDQSTVKTRITQFARCLVANYTAGVVNRTASNSAVVELQSDESIGWRHRTDNSISREKSGAEFKHGMHVDILKCRIRRLTPRECFRLHGFPDTLIERAQRVCSDAQLYRQAGNAVTVNVARAIADRIYESERM